MTKRNKGFVWSYDHSTAETLWGVYGRPSEAKRRAYLACLETMRDFGGYAGRIISFNTFLFSFAFKYKGENGEERMRVDTGKNVYDFSLEA